MLGCGQHIVCVVSMVMVQKHTIEIASRLVLFLSTSIPIIYCTPTLALSKLYVPSVLNYIFYFVYSKLKFSTLTRFIKRSTNIGIIKSFFIKFPMNYRFNQTYRPFIWSYMLQVSIPANRYMRNGFCWFYVFLLLLYIFQGLPFKKIFLKRIIYVAVLDTQGNSRFW